MINYLMESNSLKLTKILNLLENYHNISLNLNEFKNLKQIINTYNYINNICNSMIFEGVGGKYNNKEYNQAYLIKEAIGIFLSEITPKRRKKILNKI